MAYLDQVLGEDDVKWVTSMKANITEYLKTPIDGQFFLRMVETILARDRNWVRWKIENCPLIERPPIDPKNWTEAMADAKSKNTSKKIRTNAMQQLSLDFLKDGDDERAMEELKDPKRHKLPEVKSFKRGIQEAELEIEMPMSNASLREAVDSKASKAWRALRIASRTKLFLFDKIDSYEDINILFDDGEPKQAAQEDEEDGMENGEHGDTEGEGKGADDTAVTKNGANDEPSTSSDQNGTAVEAMVTDN